MMYNISFRLNLYWAAIDYSIVGSPDAVKIDGRDLIIFLLSQV